MENQHNVSDAMAPDVGPASAKEECVTVEFIKMEVNNLSIPLFYF